MAGARKFSEIPRKFVEILTKRVQIRKKDGVDIKNENEKNLKIHPFPKSQKIGKINEEEIY